MAYALIQDEAAYEDVLRSLEGTTRYGVDTEFLRERTFFPVLALVQIAWPGGLALLDPFQVDLTRLRPLFESDALAITHACSQDLPILETAIGVRPGRLFDTQIAAGFLGHGVPSLGALVEKTLGVRLEKGAQLTDWTRRPLDERARAYAASDVAHLLELHDQMAESLASRGRLGWAEEECAVALEKSSERPLDEAWWRLKGKAKLRGSARGVAQSLARFRLEEAAERDIPVKRIYSDMAVLAMASRPPQKRKDFERVRGLGSMDGAFARRLLEAVRRGVEMDSADLCLPPKRAKGEEQKAAVALCSAWLAQLAKSHGIETATLATRDDIEARLQGRPGRLDTGWRHDLSAEGIDALRSGRGALRIADGALELVHLPS